MPLINWQMALALPTAVLAFWAARIIHRRDEVAAGGASTLSQVVHLAGAVFFLIALSVEVDIAVLRLDPSGAAVTIYGEQLLRLLSWTALWSLGGLVLLLLGRRRGDDTALLLTAGWVLIVLGVIAWLIFDTLSFRLSEGIVQCTVVINAQFGLGVMLAALLVIGIRHWRRRAVDGTEQSARAVGHIALGFTLLGAIGLWLGSMEIDRFFAEETMAAQAGLSVYWAGFGVLLVVIGFAKRAAAARYAGLALLTVTVVKVLLVDLATVERIWRVISCFASGILLVGTSLLYTKLSPRILAELQRKEP